MKILLLVFVTLFIVSGCGRTYYRNINPARNFNQDASYCQAVAIGSVPMPNAPQYQNNVPMYAPGSGTMRDQYGNTYRYQENYNAMAAAQSNMAMAQQNFNNASASLNAFSAQMEAQGARNTIAHQCMAQLGWREISKEEYDMMNNRRATHGTGGLLATPANLNELHQQSMEEFEQWRQKQAQANLQSAQETEVTEVRLAIVAYPPEGNAEAVAQRIKSGGLSFEEAVRQYSIDPATNKNNGMMPPAPWKGMSPEWRTRVSTMKVGDVSDIFIIPHEQFQIKAQIKLLERR